MFSNFVQAGPQIEQLAQLADFVSLVISEPDRVKAVLDDQRQRVRDDPAGDACRHRGHDQQRACQRRGHHAKRHTERRGGRSR